MIDRQGEVDVVVAGCGPTGATLALLLAQSGVSTVLLEREQSIYPLPRAVHFDDHVMRVFQTLGVAEAVNEVARYNPGMRFVDPTGELLLDWPRPAGTGENGWHTSYRFHQPDLEKILRRQIQNEPSVQLKTGVEVVGLQQDENGVEVEFYDRVNTTTGVVTPRYIVGCDGARSFVRSQISAGVEDLGCNEHWLVVDLLLHKAKPELGDFTIQHCGGDRPATYVRCPANRRRWEIALKPDDDIKTIADPASIWSLLDQWISPLDGEIERSAVYEFKSVIASQWRDRRVFIAGDAAHLTPPFMGQGMCAGIRDAANLSWKIAAVCQSEKINHGVTESLLDSYQSERRVHVKEYIETAIRLGELMNSCSTRESLTQGLARKDGTMHMSSIVPGLGAGLGAGLGFQSGVWFPQPELSGGSRLDDVAGFDFVLIVDPVLRAEFQRRHAAMEIDFTVLCAEVEPALRKLLGVYEAQAVLVRPDRYVLGVANNVAECEALIATAMNYR